jgi:hypothetical protein
LAAWAKKSKIRILRQGLPIDGSDGIQKMGDVFTYIFNEVMSAGANGHAKLRPLGLMTRRGDPATTVFTLILM